MTYMMKTLGAASLLALTVSLVWAKLPAPSDEAKAKAGEAATKTAWAGKVDAYLLCKSQDKVVAQYKNVPASKEAKPPAKGASAAAPAPGACADPGPFVYTPVAAASAGAASGVAVAPAVAAAPSASQTVKP